MIIGHVDEVNGKGGEQIAGFIPTRHELVQLVKYWYSGSLGHDWFYFCTGWTGSSEWRTDAFANQRIARIASLIGEADVNKAIDEVREEFKSDPAHKELWPIFCNGSEAERDD